MKRHVQHPGVRKWSGDDLLELQSESLSVPDRFFSQYGNCVICGCAVSGSGISAGLASIGGMVLPVENTAVDAFPVYLVKAEEHFQREYADEVVRDIAVRHFAKAVYGKPESPDYIEVPETGATTFFDKMESSWLADMLGKLEGLKNTDKTLSDAIALLKKADTDAGMRIAALEKRMPSTLDHAPTENDDGYAVGAEVLVEDGDGNKTFWKCYGNTAGKAVWKSIVAMDADTQVRIKTVRI